MEVLEIYICECCTVPGSVARNGLKAGRKMKQNYKDPPELRKRDDASLDTQPFLC